MKDQEHLLIRSAFKQKIERTPVWVMRQAGRYLPEYRAVREKAGNFLDLCQNAELAAEVSIQPFELVGADAVIMFSDILTPLMGMGMDLKFNPGPVFSNPIKTQSDIDALKIVDPDKGTPYVGKILKILTQELSGKTPIIGFAGAPFTLASYLIEGQGSKLFSKTKSLFWEHKDLARQLMTKLTQMTINYLNYQIENGAQMVQLFDTWAGIFSAEEYQEHVFPYIQEIFSNIHQAGKVPKVYYINGSHHLLETIADSGADVISLDWTSDIGEVKTNIGHKVALQGNLDPSVLFCKPAIIKDKVVNILDKFGSDSGHIFNLGHGIDKNVDPEHLRFMIRTVKEQSKRY
jgi:uroporphyrinogen decarboxylase